MHPNHIDMGLVVACAAATVLIANVLAIAFFCGDRDLNVLCDNIKSKIDESLRLIAEGRHTEALNTVRLAIDTNLGPLGGVILTNSNSKLSGIARRFYGDANWQGTGALQAPRRLQMRLCKIQGCNSGGLGRGPHSISLSGTVTNPPVQDLGVVRPVPVVSFAPVNEDITQVRNRTFQAAIGPATVLVNVVIDDIDPKRELICDCAQSTWKDIGYQGAWANYIQERAASSEEFNKWVEGVVFSLHKEWSSTDVVRELKSIRRHLRGR